jgi:hypothetical protein
MEDENGLEYKGKVYTEKSYEDKSPTLGLLITRRSIWGRVKKWFVVD